MDTNFLFSSLTPSPLIPHPSSLIPHPSSLIPYLKVELIAVFSTGFSATGVEELSSSIEGTG